MTGKFKSSCNKGGRVPCEDKVPLPSSFLECIDAIYSFSQVKDPDKGGEGTPVALSSLKKHLGLNADLVAERVLGLNGRGLVEYIDSEYIRITPLGKQIAVGIIRKHRLLERFMVDILALPWEDVHEESRRLAFILSDQVGDRLAKFLKYPATCPHGNPIPSSGGSFNIDNAIPLHRLKQGGKGVILRIEKEEPETLKYLASLGLFPKTKIEVEEVAPFGGPIMVRVGTSRYALGRKVAAKIFVKEG